MAFLIPLFALPVSLLVGLLLNQFGGWAHRSSEQVRLDAVVLSLCHHRQHFIISKIESLNAKIQMTLKKMDAFAPPCDSAPPHLKAATCAIFYGLSVFGKSLEILQTERLLGYHFSRRELLHRLVSENQLDSTNGKFSWGQRSLGEGFKREKVDLSRSRYKSIPLTAWPRKLIPSQNFNSANRFFGEFLPIRLLVGVSSNRHEDWQGLKTFEHQTGERSQSRSLSECRIFSEGGERYRVERVPFERFMGEVGIQDED